ncbi:hypothetical protein SMICM304S_05493 [Streptomyces microflavus]
MRWSPRPTIAALAAAGLDGIEIDHMDHDEPTRARLRGLARELELLPTGSSDYHGSRKTVALGEYTTDPEIYGEITRRATGSLPGAGRPVARPPRGRTFGGSCGVGPDPPDTPWGSPSPPAPCPTPRAPFAPAVVSAAAHRARAPPVPPALLSQGSWCSTSLSSDPFFSPFL